MRAPRLVIFDCDGVLIDSEVVACRVDAACLTEIGVTITAEQVMERYVGIGLVEMLADIAAKAGRELPADLADAMRRRTAAAFESELMAIAGVDAVLTALRLPRCVASGSEPARIRQSLTLTGLLHHFEPHVFSATQVAHGKPAPDLFLFAAATMGVAPAECQVIEDSVAGVRAACAAGMPVLGFTGGSHCRPGHDDRLRSAGATTVFADMWRLPELLAG